MAVIIALTWAAARTVAVIHSLRMLFVSATQYGPDDKATDANISQP